MTLAYDMARCMVTQQNADCPLAALCLRRTPGRPGYQAMTAYKGGTDCEGFVA
jgi:hypothetical protein